VNFNEFELNDRLAVAIELKGYSKPSLIQLKSIPLILEGKDLIGQARTGTGKTAAFSIPLIERINTASNRIQALVVVPTRELAVQVQNEIRALSKGQGIHCLAVFGGQSIAFQVNELRRGQHLVVATPGRLMDLMRRNNINLSSVKTVVLDEADKMLDMGFRDDIDFILSNCPRERQTLLFSATMPDEIKRLASRHLSLGHVFVNVSEDRLAVEKINQFFVSVDPKKKVSTLARIVRKRHMTKCLVFCRTRRTAEWVARELSKRNVRARSIHGGLRQNLRQSILKNFSTGRIPVLVSTDLLSRGMDLSDISHIINFDFPKERETYIHRIGRTARFGKKGEAITFCSNVREFEEMERLKSLIQSPIKELKEFAS